MSAMTSSPGESGAGEEKVTALGMSEGDGQIGRGRDRVGGAGVGIDAAGQVHGRPGAGACSRGVGRAWPATPGACAHAPRTGGRDAGAEQRIDDHAGAASMAARSPLESRLAGDRTRHATLAESAQVRVVIGARPGTGRRSRPRRRRAGSGRPPARRRRCCRARPARAPGRRPGETRRSTSAATARPALSIMAPKVSPPALASASSRRISSAVTTFAPARAHRRIGLSGIRRG